MYFKFKQNYEVYLLQNWDIPPLWNVGHSRMKMQFHICYLFVIFVIYIDIYMCVCVCVCVYTYTCICIYITHVLNMDINLTLMLCRNIYYKTVKQISSIKNSSSIFKFFVLNLTKS